MNVHVGSARLLESGFALVSGILNQQECEDLSARTSMLSDASPGSRCLLSFDWCKALAVRVRQHPKLARFIPTSHLAVQCTYLEKSLERNWLVPIHQDLSISVAERVHEPVLRGWSEKEGSIFVQPPISVLEEMVAIRLHLDPCGAGDGPLQVVPGSHRQGRITAQEAIKLRAIFSAVSCTLERGDALAMRPLLLHQSSNATGSGARRVLHFLFGPPVLPFGLSWRQAT